MTERLSHKTCGRRFFAYFYVESPAFPSGLLDFLTKSFAIFLPSYFSAFDTVHRRFPADVLTSLQNPLQYFCRYISPLLTQFTGISRRAS